MRVHSAPLCCTSEYRESHSRTTGDCYEDSNPETAEITPGQHLAGWKLELVSIVVLRYPGHDGQSQQEPQQYADQEGVGLVSHPAPGQTLGEEKKIKIAINGNFLL